MKYSPQPWNPLRLHRFQMRMLVVLVPLYAVWMIAHWQSYAIVNAALIAIGLAAVAALFAYRLVRP